MQLEILFPYGISHLWTSHLVLFRLSHQFYAFFRHEKKEKILWSEASWHNVVSWTKWPYLICNTGLSKISWINYSCLGSNIWFILIINFLSDWHNVRDYFNLGNKFHTLKGLSVCLFISNKLYRINRWVSYFRIWLSTTGILLSSCLL